MEAYCRASSISVSEETVKDPHEVHIKSGKKIRACISQALKILQTTKERVIITGSGPTVTKAITTAEIVKRKVKGLHQQNTLFYSKTEDFWEPKEEGLDRLKVTRNIPSMSILLSHIPLNNNAPGYQAPGVSQPLIQFRDEDIELADDRNEGNNSLRQSQHHLGKGRTGVRDNRKKPEPKPRYQNKKPRQESQTEKGNPASKEHGDTRSSEQNREARRKRGGYHGGQWPSKRPYSDKERLDHTTELSRNEKTSETSRTSKTLS